MPLYFRQTLLFGLILFTVLFAQAAFSQDVGGVVSADDELVILAYGDSLVAGYGLQPGQDFPTQLEKHLNHNGVNVRVVNAGVSGETTAGGVARMNWTLDGIEPKPDIVFLALGANDMLRALPPEQAQQNLGKMIQEFHERGIFVVLAGMRAASNLGPEYATSFDTIYPVLAASYDRVLLYPFLLEGVAGVSELNQKDGIHPNTQGVAVMVERIEPIIQKAIELSQRSGIDNPLK